MITPIVLLIITTLLAVYCLSAARRIEGIQICLCHQARRENCPTHGTHGR